MSHTTGNVLEPRRSSIANSMAGWSVVVCLASVSAQSADEVNPVTCWTWREGIDSCWYSLRAET